ncbi:hypothetical protein POJ06DRAFT_41633 [Lipomyces tetrasporus]|uniref:Uncharacterized protein n=1 Tax=Lipomyces tetrasporus TaxID=54092 RepID=A0AAD7QKP8_9ASCO|nr:uncharacterized protein POJ06DRAFT_41633 [Lipomyces tetrasporus]KAJ8096621.1 hypothetical protein POJ06DRAFT_41633 [Lipomyces tetrasporus]
MKQTVFGAYLYMTCLLILAILASPVMSSTISDTVDWRPSSRIRLTHPVDYVLEAKGTYVAMYNVHSRYVIDAALIKLWNLQRALGSWGVVWR